MNKSEQVSFIRMDEGTFEDYQLLHEKEADYFSGTPKRILAQLEQQGEESLSGYQISRL